MVFNDGSDVYAGRVPTLNIIKCLPMTDGPNMYWINIVTPLSGLIQALAE